MLKVSNLSVKLGGFDLSNLSFEVKQGEYFMLLGASGSGKSVVLECLAGLFPKQEGEVFLNDKDVSGEAIQKRSFGLVFQDYALFPHLSVFDNIAFPLKRNRYTKPAIAEKVKDLALDLEIAHLLHRNPRTLSGGEQQRVALARTLAMEPHVLLLDEPLAAIDVSLKAELRALLRKINKKGQTIIHVTHDYEEAISLAHRVAILHKGSIVQQGTPNEVFANPKSKFVAHFSGIRNFYPVQLEKDPLLETTKAWLTEKLSFQILTKHKVKKGFVLIGQKNIMVSDSCKGFDSINHFKGTVIDLSPARFGYDILVQGEVGIQVAVTENTVAHLNIHEGMELWVGFNPSSVRFLPG
jgi:molybdate transport system ATP-binding protein/molybdate/tungstate transport system ATP-binding protein